MAAPQLRTTTPTTNRTAISPAAFAGPGAARRSTPMALVGVAAVVVGALVFLGLYVGADRRQSVLVAARPVAPGQIIVAEDLGVADIAVSEGTGVVPASQAGAVVGQSAAVGLVPGAVLSPAQLGASSGLQGGQAQVGAILQPGQAPLGLRQGSRVRVVDTGATAAGEDVPARVVSADAVVSDVGAASSASTSKVVSLIVPEAEATAVAAAGAAGRLSLVVIPS